MGNDVAPRKAFIQPMPPPSGTWTSSPRAVPITRDEFDTGELNLDATLLAFLREHSDAAFASNELVFELDAQGIPVSLDDAAAALSRLVERSRVDSKEIAAPIYYSYNRFLGFRPPTG